MRDRLMEGQHQVKPGNPQFRSPLAVPRPGLDREARAVGKRFHKSGRLSVDLRSLGGRPEIIILVMHRPIRNRTVM
jgi:hypothetical protein